MPNPASQKGLRAGSENYNSWDYFSRSPTVHNWGSGLSRYPVARNQRARVSTTTCFDITVARSKGLFALDRWQREATLEKG